LLWETRMKKVFLFSLFLFLLTPIVLASDCDLARSIGKKAIKLFQTNKKKGLIGLIKAYELCPEDERIVFNLGLAYWRYGARDKALETWAKGYKKFPTSLKICINYASSLLEFGKYEKALEVTNACLKQHKREKHLIDTKAKALFYLGKYEDAYAFLAFLSGFDTLKKKAAGYMVEEAWQVFRQGEREDATKKIVALAKKYPGESLFAETKDKMLLALIDETIIPLPKPLPHKMQAETIISASTTADVLDNLIKPIKIKKKDHAYAVIVGISKYKHFSGPHYARRDAENFFKVLVNKGILKKDDAHVKLRLNKRATYGNLWNDIEWLCEKGKLYDDASIIFYFSGHGSPLLARDEKTIKDGLLIPYEVALNAISPRTTLPVSEIRNKFESLRAKDVLVIIDACFTGTGKSKTSKKLIKPVVDLAVWKSQKLFISAASPDRAAQEYETGKQGAFTYFFLKALLGQGDRDKDGWVDTFEAFSYAREMLERLDLRQNPLMTPRNVRIKLTKVR